MKKILSIMLAVMLVLSSFVMVSADGEFNVIEVNNTSKAHNIEPALETGYYRVSVDVYLTEGTAASVAANDGTADVASADANGAAVDVWQTVSLEVKNAAVTKLVLTATGGKAYFNNIKIDQLYSATLVYEENFEGAAGEDIGFTNRSSATYWDPLKNVKENPETSFTYQSFDGRTVGALDYPKSIKPSAVRYDEKGNKLDTQTYSGENYEIYSIDIEKIKDSDHIYIEFDLYNAATAWNEKVLNDPAGYDLINNRAYVNDTFIVGAYPSYDYCIPNEPSASEASFGAINLAVNKAKGKGSSDGIENYIAHKNPVHAWSKVTYEIKRVGSGPTQAIYQKVSYGDTKLEGELINAWERFNSFRKITFSVDSNYGGKFYIDNLKVYDLSDISADGYVTRYYEDFDNANYEIGQDVPGFAKYGVDPNVEENHEYATFTVEKDTSLAYITSNYGRLYNSRHKASGYTYYEDDGTTPDNNAQQISDNTNSLAFKHYLEVMEEPGWGVSKEGDTKKTKLSFKYYFPGSVLNADKLASESMQVMLREKTDNRLWDNNAFTATAALYPPNKLYVNGSNGAVIDGEYRKNRWVPVEFEITSTLTNKENNLYTHVITYKLNGTQENDMYQVGVGHNQSQLTFNDAKDLNALHFYLNDNIGGSMFIDDIKVESSFVDSDYDALNKIASPVYSKNAKVDGLNELYTINSASFAADAQSVNMTMTPYAPEKVQIVTAMFKGGVLDSAKINEFNVTTETAFVPFDFNLNEKITLPAEISGETFKVFVIDSVDGLKPLADMFTK